MTALLNILKQGSTQRGLVWLAAATLLYFHPELANSVLPSVFGAVGALGVAVSDAGVK